MDYPLKVTRWGFYKFIWWFFLLECSIHVIDQKTRMQSLSWIVFFVIILFINSELDFSWNAHDLISWVYSRLTSIKKGLIKVCLNRYSWGAGKLGSEYSSWFNTVLQRFPVIFDVKIHFKNWRADQATFQFFKNIQIFL